MGFAMQQLDRAISSCAAQCKQATLEGCQKIVREELNPIASGVGQTIKTATWLSLGLTVGYIVYQEFIK
jgi:hypothetical protein